VKNKIGFGFVIARKKLSQKYENRLRSFLLPGPNSVEARTFVGLSCFIPKYIKYEAPTNLTIRNRVDEATNNVPNPRIESSDSMNKPKIFARDEVHTIFIFPVIPLVIAKKIAGPGLVI
jgi:hypothetical protein